MLRAFVECSRILSGCGNTARFSHAEESWEAVSPLCSRLLDYLFTNKTFGLLIQNELVSAVGKNGALI